MIFNNLQVSNILGTSYLSGNVAFSPVQQQILFTPLNNVVKKINLKNNESEILPFETPHQISHLVLSPNGVVLIAIDKAGYSVIFNLKGYFTIAEFNFKGVVITAQFSSDGELFAIAQDHGFIVYKSPCLYRTFEPFVLVKKYKNRHSSNITTIRFSPDNRFLLTAGQDNIIYLNNLFPVEGYIAFSLEVHRYKIVGMYFSHDMKYIYSVDSGSNVYVWKWVNDYLTEGYKNQLASKKRKLANLRGQQQSQDLKQQHDTLSQKQSPQHDKSIYSEFQNQVTEGRFILAKKLIVTQPGEYLKRVFYNPSNGFFASAYSKGKFSIYKLLDQELTEVQTFSVGDNKISTLAVNSSGAWICLGLKSYGQIIVWEWKSQSYILNQKGFIHETQAVHFNKHKLLATGTNDGKVKVWDKVSGFCLATFQEHESQVTDVKFSNKNTLFSSSLDGSVNAYDILKYKRFRKFKPDMHCQLTCLEIDESEDIIFAGSFDPYEVYSWNVQTGSILQIVRGHTSPVSCIKMASDKLITGSWDKTLKVHEVFARKLNVETFEHSSQITCVAVHPNKKQCAAATMKGQIYIWDVEGGNLIGIIDSEIQGGRSYFSKISADNDKSSKYIKCLEYSTCGNYLFGGGKSKYLYVYDIKHRMLLQKVCLTKNKDLQGTLQKLNSRYVKDGITTYQMTLEEQEIDSDNQNYQKLPGAKKLDISEIRMKLEVDVKKIVVLNSKQIAVNTSFGVLLISPLLSKKEIFNPYELTPNLVPEMLPQLYSKKEFSSFIVVGLKLNMNIRKLIAKIPVSYISQTLSQIQDQKQVMILQKLVEKEITYRQLNWVQKILENLSSNGKNLKESLPISLRASIEGIEQQVNIMGRNKSILEMGLLVSYQSVDE